MLPCPVYVVLVIGQRSLSARQPIYQIRCIPSALTLILKNPSESIATQTCNIKAPLSPPQTESKLAFLVFVKEMFVQNSVQ